MAGRNKKYRGVGNYYNRYWYWMRRIIRLASSSVRWEGLPTSIDTNYLEQCLCRSGSAIIVYDDVLDLYLCGQNASVGQLDIYGYPMDRRVIFMNGQNANYDDSTSVIVYNNTMREADWIVFKMIASRMADFDMAVDVNVNTQKTMPIVPANDNNKLTVQQLYESQINNVPYVMIDPSSLDLDAFKSALQFDNRKSFTADGIIQVQRDVWNWFLTYIGINSVNEQKKERLIVPEATANNEEVVTMRRSRINSRERACQQMKNLWGMDVSVGYWADNVSRETLAEGGDISGGLYNRSQNDLRTDVSEQDRETNSTERS